MSNSTGQKVLNSAWEYAAQCATSDGHAPGTGAWWARLRELLPIISEDTDHDFPESP